MRGKGFVRDLSKLNTFASFGFIIVSNILVGAILGAFLDGVFNTKKIIFVVFLLLGVASGLYNGFKYLFHEIEKLQREERDGEDAEKRK